MTLGPQAQRAKRGLQEQRAKPGLLARLVKPALQARQVKLGLQAQPALAQPGRRAPLGLRGRRELARLTLTGGRFGARLIKRPRRSTRGTRLVTTTRTPILRACLLCRVVALRLLSLAFIRSLSAFSGTTRVTKFTTATSGSVKTAQPFLIPIPDGVLRRATGARRGGRLARLTTFSSSRQTTTSSSIGRPPTRR